jgi:CRISPR-associated endonuclease/helicase Cas3
MNVMFISQCEKRALTQTRRILDQFAERRGERTWQTPITQDGLNTVRKLLRQTARKNTAISCHWIRGLDHTELLWIVGDTSQFNQQGAVPTNTTQRNILRAEDENDWHTGEDIFLLTALSALLHDLGKASVAFQKKLKGLVSERNQYRHEWVSLRLFQAFVGQDDDATWLARLANPSEKDDRTWLERLQRDGLDVNVKKPFEALKDAPIARAVGWLVVTHHRLPREPNVVINTEEKLKDVLNNVTAFWNEYSKAPGHEDSVHHHSKICVQEYWDIPLENLPVTTTLWKKKASRTALGLLKRLETQPMLHFLDNPYVMHISRMCLMLADHFYSSLSVAVDGKPQDGRVQGEKNFKAYANTYSDTKTNKRAFNQPLDEHLLGVAHHSGYVTRAVPSLKQELPHLAHHKGLKKPTTDLRFRWQNKAAEMAGSLRTRSEVQGAFIVNLASTGSGKTLANARIMYAMADSNLGMRCVFAMGLRTLTLQTGKAFQNLLSLGEDELAIRVGGSAQRALFEHQMEMAELTGSASTQSLLDEDSHVTYEGNSEAHPLLQKLVSDKNAKSLITAPILVCTIDHLMPACESTRGGHQMAPVLRLMTSDLVLDEPDDFDIADLPALTRLVYWAGLLGSRVLLSSATLPPDMVQGLFGAYLSGRKQFKRNRGETNIKPLEVCVAWVDEFQAHTFECPDIDSFVSQHEMFVKQRIDSINGLDTTKPRPARLAQLTKLELKLENNSSNTLPEQLALRIFELAPNLHKQHHTVDPHTKKRVSFGLVRMANIAPLVEVALALFKQSWPDGTHVHLCTYHSQYPLLLRSRIEQQLDAAMDRRHANAVFDLSDIRGQLDAHVGTDDHIFLVLGSPVTEVGRDHDYDWAIVEPSSMRSLIQLAGRVRRHRPLLQGQKIDTPNIRVFQKNLKHYKNGGMLTKPCFTKPGFEHKDFKLESHDLVELMRHLLNPSNAEFFINATPRLLAETELQATKKLADLEHARMRDMMLPRSSSTSALNAASNWHLPPQDASLTAILPRLQQFRYDASDDRNDVEFRLVPSDDGDDFVFERAFDQKGAKQCKEEIWVNQNTVLERIKDKEVKGQGISAWCDTDYLQALSELADEMEKSPEECARRFGRVTLKEPKNGIGTRWRFHPALGFTKAG